MRWRNIWRFFDIRNQIRKKIAFTCLMILLPALAVPAVLYYQKSAQTMQTMMSQNMFDLTEIVGRDIESYIDDVETLTNAPYYSSETQQTLLTLKYKVGLQRAEAESKLFNTIDVLLGLRKDINGIYIFDDTNNRYYKTSVGDVTPFYSFVDQPWFAKIKSLHGERLIIPTHKADYFVSPKTKYVFSIGRSIVSKETNEEIGLIYVDMDLQVIRNILSSLKQKKSTEFFIVDNEGSLVYSYDEKNLGEPFDRPELMSDGKPREGNQIIRLDDRRQLMTSNYSKKVGWWYITATDLEPLLQPNERAIRNIILISTVLLLVLLSIISFLVSSSITNPIKQLQKAMRQLDNDRFLPVGGIHTRDEIGSLVNSYNDMIRKIADLINTVYKAGIKEREAQLIALQTQINPHFLHNTLNSISCMAEVQGVQEISIVCKAVSDLFRYSIKAGSGAVALREEIASIKQYMTIQSFRYENRIEAVFNVDESLLDCKVLKLSLQPIVENAVYHGLEPKRGKGVVIIGMETEEDALILSVFDNGIGMNETRLARMRQSLVESIDITKQGPAGGVGLKNVHDRLQLYYGDHYGLKINSAEGTGTSVLLRMPLTLEKGRVSNEDPNR
ncbi:sensor histidine kinase [Cohnella silvisoli]|uniref:histidine kinase n=1 Tax=Cohnella silvisoli TaxID=2873699 RepID=A0ABV1KXG7_9BACL|nr:sensor histidine kinase [Cohnella silvisoli]MCD9024188.1 sensor histidine kinase [Cohnella silvisoli]